MLNHCDRSFIERPRQQKQKLLDRLQKCLKWGSSKRVSHHGLPQCCWLLRKQGSKERFVIDYRRINSVTEDMYHPLITMEDVIDTMSENQPKTFSPLDLKSGYRQVPLDPETAHKSDFSTHQGHFEFTRMPFGLCNAPFAIQNLMHSRPPKNDLPISFSLH